MNARRYLAELVGTFILVLVGSLSIVAAVEASAPVLVVVPFGFGLALLAALFAVGGISGGHFNPAVTLGALLDRRIPVRDAIGYAVAQVIGGIGASAVLLILWSRDAVAGTRNAPGGGVGEIQAFGAEVALTAIFLLVILTVTRNASANAAFTVAFTLIAIHFAGIPLSGASVNPARALGPALISGDLGSLWVYLTAPFVGAVVGWGLFRVLHPDLD